MSHPKPASANIKTKATQAGHFKKAHLVDDDSKKNDIKTSSFVIICQHFQQMQTNVISGAIACQHSNTTQNAAHHAGSFGHRTQKNKQKQTTYMDKDKMKDARCPRA